MTLPHCDKVLRLTQRDRVAIASGQAGETIRRSIDKPGPEILFAKSVESQKLAYGQCDRAVFRRNTDQFSLEVGVCRVLRFCDQAVNRIVELGDDGHCIRAGECRLDQEWSCDV